MKRSLLAAGLALSFLMPLFGDKAGTTAGVGVDMNYALEMERAGRTWNVDGKQADVFETMAKAGCDRFRVRLWVGEDGVNGLNDALETARRAQAAGMKPLLTIFLSDQWADFVKQPRPAVWKDLDLEALLKEVETYTERVARRFSEAGIKVEAYEIGNEIDFGVCGIFEEEWTKRVSLDHMRTSIWPKMAGILSAAQRGVRKVVPDARFVLHLTQWENAEFCVEFWKLMIAQGVAVDFAGLSYFPTAAAAIDHRSLAYLQGRIGALHGALKKPVVICETGYPAEAWFGGQFADWNKSIPGYPQDESGQQRWLADLVKMARTSDHLAAVFYWSPERAGSDIWSAFALFDPKGKARPALSALSGAATEAAPLPPPAPVVNPPTSEPMQVFFGNLHSHTSYSDGKGTPEQAFAHARDVAKLDFLAVTEHNHLLGGDTSTPETKAALYKGPPASALRPTADRFTVSGKFIAFSGQEYSSMSKGNHVNLFDVPEVIALKNGEFDELLPWLEANRDSSGNPPVMQLNHPALGSPFPPFPALRWRDFGRDDFGSEGEWVKRMGAASSLIEVLNGEPPAGSTDRRAPQVMENYYVRFLQLGFHLAPTGNQDNHEENWGTATEVRTAILSEHLTKPALLAALRARHTYATEDRNLKVIARIGGRLMGEVIRSQDSPTPQLLELRIEDEGEPDADYTIEVIRGRIGGPLAGVAASHRIKGNSPAGSSISLGKLDFPETGTFVFLRITQSSKAGDDRVWTAPVWWETGNE